jgi:hypothetical protein
MVKAIRGDVRASDVLLKHSMDKDMLPTEGGFFSQSELKITVVDGKGQSYPAEALGIDEATGTIVGYSN